MKTVIGITGRVGVGKTYLVDGALKINPTYDVIDLDKLGHHVLQKERITIHTYIGSVFWCR